MNERLQRVLDEEIPTASLNSHDADAFADARRLIKAVVASIPGRRIPDLSPEVMRRIRALPEFAGTPARRHPATDLLDWFWRPRALSLQWRPAYAMAVAVLAIGIATIRPAAAPTVPSQQVLVQFRLDAPDAGQVQLAGNFTDWKAAVSMKRTGAGVWTVVLPLTPGVHNYAFVVDGKQWVPDPMAPAVSDGFGGLNSQLAVLSPDQARSM